MIDFISALFHFLDERIAEYDRQVSEMFAELAAKEPDNSQPPLSTDSQPTSKERCTPEF